jgi:hypothetical protein
LARLVHCGATGFELPPNPATREGGGRFEAELTLGVPIDPHRLAEARSLAAHRVIAARLLANPELLEQARARVEAWLSEQPCTHGYADAWRELLASDIESVARTIAEDSERGRTLRQSTPFAGVLDPRERWALWAEVREELERQ